MTSLAATPAGRAPVEVDADRRGDLHAHVAREPRARRPPSSRSRTRERRARPRASCASRSRRRPARAGRSARARGSGRCPRPRRGASGPARARTPPGASRGRPRARGGRAACRSSGMTSPRSARWSRKRRTLSGSATRAPRPSSSSKRVRRHRRDVLVREAPVRPDEAGVARRDGGDARAPAAASVTRGARGSSRRASSGAARRPRTGAARRAREARARVREEAARLDRRPRVMASSPSVKNESGISSPRRTRSRTEKSVVTSIPRLIAFWR